MLGWSILKRPFTLVPSARVFTGPVRYKHEYAPRFKDVRKQHKGRVPVRTGGSTKGSTLEFGTFGLRLKSEGVRLAAIQLKEADNSLMRTLRPLKGKLIRRTQTNIAVCTKGNETRMGKGKGPFDYWAVRIPTGKILFEISGANVHEQVARDAFKVAADKLPGTYEFVKIGDAPRIGIRAFGEVAPKKVDHFELRRQNPTKRDLNIAKSKELREFFNR